MDALKRTPIVLGPMKRSILRILCILHLPLVCALADSNTVVNLSHYDRMRVDFERMREQGIEGVIHESTYPPSVRDAMYRGRQGAATRAGLLWGAYHFANASNPIREADFYLNVVESAWRSADPQSRPSEVLLVLDFEKNGHYPGGTMRVDQAVAFIERVRQRTGKYPGLYSNENRIRTVLNSRRVTAAQAAVLARCWLWVANYHRRPGKLPPWSRWDLWQYTGDGICDLPRSSYPKHIANVRNAERNIFRGGATEVKWFWKQHGWNPSM